MTQPWASGPREILEHGLNLLLEDSDRNRRLAMISIDNAVELMIKTYLGLPRRVTGLPITRREFNEVSESYPRLLDALEKFSPDKLDGIDLGEIEWYHRLRNELYHQGNGLTVERVKVEIYAELAKSLFRNLFRFDVGVNERDETIRQRAIGKFLQQWVEIERALVELAASHSSKLPDLGHKPAAGVLVVRHLAEARLLEPRLAEQIIRIQQLRNRLVHGQGDLCPEDLDRESSLLKNLSNRVRSLPRGAS
jgi:uncharacterized protein YutE (UPF0331/DUF86 family)